MINMYAFINVYGKTTTKKVRINSSNIMVFFILSTIAFLINYSSLSFLKLFLPIIYNLCNYLCL